MKTDDGASWLLYGATGYTAGLIAREAVRRGLRPILAGRDEGRVTRLGQELGLESRTSTLGELGPVLRGVSVVLLAAGPYAETAAPVAEACVRAGVHYLDLSGELPAIEPLAARDAEARARGVMLLPSIGFDVVATNCLAAHVARRVRDPRRLRLGIAGLDLISRGSARSSVLSFGKPVQVRRNHALVSLAAAGLRRDFDYGRGPAASVAVTWADLSASHYATGIANIETYVQETATLRWLQTLNRGFGWAGNLPGSRAWMDFQASLLPPGPTASERRGRRATVVAEVEGADGRVARSRLETPEVYDFTVDTALATVARVLRGDVEPGFQTPARVYGADFAMRGDVQRCDLDDA
jgi:short subunit dehydrogenase-like uncharacterized protein